PSLLDALRRNRRVKCRVAHGTGRSIVDTLEKRARDAETGSHDAARIAGVHAFGQHFDREPAVHEAAQRGRAPELLVASASRTEPDDERGRAYPRRERVEVRGKIVAAALLAALDHDRAAAVGAAGLPQGTQGCDRCEYRVAVVRSSSPIELAVTHHRRPASQAVGPAGHLGMLVEMAVK